jgi:CheY-like chemotaxis protein
MMRVRPRLFISTFSQSLQLDWGRSWQGIKPMESLGTPPIILLVDDDDALRRFVRQLLMCEGFQVIEASDGEEALGVAAAYKDPIDLLFTDVMMPKVDGLLLAERILQDRPRIAVLFMSGYIEKTILLEKHPEWIVLQKPFTAEALFTAVHQVLASKERQ